MEAMSGQTISGRHKAVLWLLKNHGWTEKIISCQTLKFNQNYCWKTWDYC